jgi:signal transduction histidine kinase
MMAVVLTVGLTASSVITFQVFAKFFGRSFGEKVVNRAVDFDEIDSADIQFNDGGRMIIESTPTPIGPASASDLQSNPFERPHDRYPNHPFVDSVVNDLNNSLLLFFIFTTLTIVILGTVIVYFTTHKSLQRMETERARITQFVADASHDLRTPLAVIQGYAQLLNAKSKKPVKELDKIETNATRMSSLIEDMIVLARMDQGQIASPETTQTADLAVVDLKSLLTSEVDGFKHAYTSQDANLTLMPIDGDFSITSDEKKIQRIVENILSNAHKYAGENAKVDVKLMMEQRGVGIEIVDNGPGVPPEKLSTIFDRFVTLDESRNTQGNGLGLAIVKEFITTLGGTVKASNGGNTSAGDNRGKQGGLAVHIWLPKTTAKTTAKTTSKASAKTSVREKTEVRIEEKRGKEQCLS